MLLKLDIQKATDEVNYLKVATTSLQAELEKEKSSLVYILILFVCIGL